MKKQFNNISLAILFAFAGIIMVSCTNSQKNKKTSSTSEETKEKIIAKLPTDNKLKVYYFHATRRCATCKAVETVTKNTIDKYYKTKITLEAINRDDDKNSELLKKYNIKGQSLIIVKANKKINLTSIAFLNARVNPQKLETKIKETIDSLL